MGCCRFLIIAVLLLSLNTTAWSKTGSEAMARGKTLLEEGDFRGALAEYADAVRSDRQNREYMQHYLALRQIVDVRARLERETNLKRWEQYARMLHLYYSREALSEHLLALDRRIHDKLQNATSATMLAETLLEQGEAEEMLEVLQDLPEDQRNETILALEGIALAHTGQNESAKKIAEKISIEKNDNPVHIYRLARLQGAVGNEAEATNLLVRCFESTPPSMSQSFKSHAKESSAFTAMVEKESFREALATESKVSESECSGGTSCSTCPMRGKCQGH